MLFLLYRMGEGLGTGKICSLGALFNQSRYIKDLFGLIRLSDLTKFSEKPVSAGYPFSLFRQQPCRTILSYFQNSPDRCRPCSLIRNLTVTYASPRPIMVPSMRIDVYPLCETLQSVIFRSRLVIPLPSDQRPSYGHLN